MDWRLERLLFLPTVRPVYPTLITKELFSVEPLVPEGCMEVWDVRRKRKGGVMKKVSKGKIPCGWCGRSVRAGLKCRCGATTLPSMAKKAV